MKIYYYHTRPILPALEEWREKKHPGHILYGVTEFEKEGIEVLLHKQRKSGKRIIVAFYNAVQIIKHRKKHDLLYSTHTYGLDFLILAKMIGLYKKPIVLWQHRAIHSSKNPFVNFFIQKFYKSIDKILFFSHLHISESVATGNTSFAKCSVIKWGGDIDFYDRVLLDTSASQTKKFISTGKENRDFITLIKAFNQVKPSLDLHYPISNGDLNYEKIIAGIGTISENISLHTAGGIIPYKLALCVASSFCVVISCNEHNYTVGLTTLVEALALGKPIITSDNPYFEIDVEKNKCGIKVNYYDVEGWANAINLLSSNPELAKEMGRNARILAEEEYNLKSFSKEIANIFKELKGA